VHVPGAGAELGYQAAVAGEVVGGTEAVDGADFPVDDNGEYFGGPGDGLDELDGGCGLDAFDDSAFQLLDVAIESVQELQLLGGAAGGFGGQVLEQVFEIAPPSGGEDITGAVQRKGVLGQGGGDAVLPEGHRDGVTRVRWPAKVIRVRGSSRSSRTSVGGIQTEGSLPR